MFYFNFTLFSFLFSANSSSFVNVIPTVPAIEEIRRIVKDPIIFIVSLFFNIDWAGLEEFLSLFFLMLFSFFMIKSINIILPFVDFMIWLIFVFKEQYPSLSVISNQLRMAPFSLSLYSSLKTSTFLIRLSSSKSPALALMMVSPMLGIEKEKKWSSAFFVSTSSPLTNSLSGLLRLLQQYLLQEFL